MVDDPDTGVAFKIEVGANRYDLLCIEGIARSLRIYLGLETLPKYQLLPAKEPEKYKLIVKPAVAQVKTLCLDIQVTLIKSQLFYILRILNSLVFLSCFSQIMTVACRNFWWKVFVSGMVVYFAN